MYRNPISDQDLLAYIVQETSTGFVIFDTKWKLTFVNQAILHELGISKKSLKDLKWMNWITKNHNHLNTKSLLKLMNFLWRKPQKNKLVKIFISKRKYIIVMISSKQIRINEQPYYLFTCREMTKEHFASVRAVEFHKAYRREIQTARMIQKTINNSIIDKVVGKNYEYRFYSTFLPSQDLSGDIINVSQINRRYSSVFVGDGKGHGLPAAIYSSLIYSYNSLLAMEVAKGETDIVNLVQSINKLSYHDFVKGDEYYFFSGVFVLIDGGNDCFSIVNAGHPPIFYLSSGRKIKRLTNHGPMFGISPDSSYTKNSFNSQDGQNLLLCTDGFFETAEGKGKPISQRDLLHFLAEYPGGDKQIQDLPEVLIKFKKERQGEYSIQDDISILIMSVKNKASL